MCGLATTGTTLASILIGREGSTYTQPPLCADWVLDGPAAGGKGYDGKTLVVLQYILE